MKKRVSKIDVGLINDGNRKKKSDMDKGAGGGMVSKGLD